MIKKILVSQPAPTTPKSPYFDIAEKYGVEFVFQPLIKVEGISTREFRDQRVNILDHTAVVFNSKHAIENFFRLCGELRVKLPEDMKYYGLSEQIILYIQNFVQYRKRKVFFGSSGRWPELVQTMYKHKGEKFLIPQSDVHSTEVQNLLDEKKLKYTQCVMYRTVCNPLSADALRDVDMVVLFTPAGVHSLLTSFPDFKQSNVRLACFGAATQKAMEEAGLAIDLIAPTPGAPSITKSIEQYLEEEKKKDAEAKATKTKKTTTKKATTAKAPAKKAATTTKKAATAKAKKE